MDSYIVRIYRRGEHDSHGLAGIVEIVGREEKKAFRSFEELRVILSDIQQKPLWKKGGEKRER